MDNEGYILPPQEGSNEPRPWDPNQFHSHFQPVLRSQQVADVFPHAADCDDRALSQNNFTAPSELQFPPASHMQHVDFRALSFEDVGANWGLPEINTSESTSRSRERDPTGWTINDPWGSVEEDGRRYHLYRTGAYYLPNDGQEQNRLDMQHAIWGLLLQGRLHLAPIPRFPTHVLDVATGTGVWANDFAERHPTCQVIGTDISMIQPSASPNVSWIREDSENEDWYYPDCKFDLVHFRVAIVSFTDVTRLMQQAYTNLKPGGWIEFQESAWEVYSPDGTHVGTALDRFARHTVQGFANLGRDLSLAGLQSYAGRLQQVGFVDVQVKTFMLPGNGWVDWDLRIKEAGMFTALTMTDAVESYRKVLKFSGLSAPEVDRLVEEVKQECPDRNIHWALPIYVIWGRKPYENEIPSNQTTSMHMTYG